jgi:hypothetical protein
MTLRKKHVRRIVAVLALALVLGPLGVLGAWALGLRGDAYGRAVAAELESRLHCEATVWSARPTGPLSATAEGVELAWTTSAGRITFRLEDVAAARDSAAGRWRITAGQGRLEIKSENLRETLEAWNQRLVQPAGTEAPLSIKARMFTVAVASDSLNAEEEGEFGFDKGLTTPFRAHLYRASTRGGLQPAEIKLGVHLDPRSPAGVLQAVQATLDDVPAEKLARCLLDPATVTGPMAGRAKVEVNWTRAGWTPPGLSHEPGRRITIAAKDLDLAEWTARLPGGPLRGSATLDLLYSVDDRGESSWAVDLAAGPGDVDLATIRWLRALPAALGGAPLPSTGRVTFDELSVGCTVTAGRGRFEDAAPPQGAVLLLGRVFGVEVPLLTAGARPFDARAFWAALSRGLSGAAASDEK